MEIKEEVKNRVREIKELPLWLQRAVATSTILSFILGGWGLYVILYPPTQIEGGDNPVFNATSTIRIGDILSKALTLDTVLERQDFLTKYIGSSVRGEGTVQGDFLREKIFHVGRWLRHGAVEF